MTLINICGGVPLNNSYQHTLYFPDSYTQEMYFKEKVMKTFSNYTHQRNEWSLKVDATIAQAETWNYLYYMNSDMKLRYYFITRVEYINENTVELFLELDVLQTFHFDYILKDCFVEREHTRSDEIGEHIIDEGLELGELVSVSDHEVEVEDLCILIMSTLSPNSTEDDHIQAVGSLHNNKMYTGVGVYAIEAKNYVMLNQMLNNFDRWGISDSIISIWMYPKKLVKVHNNWAGDSTFHIVTGVQSFQHEVSGGAVSSITPTNNKLLTYPYSFLYVHNNSGVSGVYHYEKFGKPNSVDQFDEGSMFFNVAGAISPEAGIMIYPTRYKGQMINYEHGINLGGYPACAWNQDVYKLWLAQNQNQQNLAVASGLISIAGGVITAAGTGGLGAVAGAGGVISGVSTIANVIASTMDKSIQPPQSKGGHSASINVMADRQTFTIQKMSVDEEHARVIDDFFIMYGYKVARMKTPSRCNREAFTYVKTIGCHVSGYLKSQDARKIESIFDNGCTFWVHDKYVCQYGQPNKPITEL